MSSMTVLVFFFYMLSSVLVAVFVSVLVSVFVPVLMSVLVSVLMSSFMNCSAWSG